MYVYICKKAIEKDPLSLKYVHYNLRTQETCLQAVKKDICTL